MARLLGILINSYRKNAPFFIVFSTFQFPGLFVPLLNKGILKLQIGLGYKFLRLCLAIVISLESSLLEIMYKSELLNCIALLLNLISC